MFFLFSYSFIGTDAPYYLSVARDISEGKLPYRDLYLSYTPVALYLMSATFLLIDSFEINFFLTFQLLLLFCCALVYYTIITKYRHIHRSLAVFLVLIFLISALSSGMQDIVLEVFLISFIFLAILFSLKDMWFAAGICLGLSFFSKQYGLIHFLPFYVFLFLQGKNKWNSFYQLSAGGLTTLGLFIMYFVLLKDITVLSLIDQLSGFKYLQHSSFNINILSIIIGGKVFLLLVLPLSWQIFRAKLNPFMKFLIVGILISLLPVVIKPYDHYYLSCFPYLFLLIAEILKLNFKEKRVIINIYMTISVIISMIFCTRMWRYRANAKEQKVISEVVDDHVPKGEEVFVEGSLRFLYLLNNYKNPVLSEVGYSYPFKPDADFIRNKTVLTRRNFEVLPTEIISFEGYVLYYFKNQ